jgi:hypothetical protein
MAAGVEGMDNGIDTRQNAPENLRLLKAQRVFYARAKRIGAIQAWTAGLTPVLGAVLTALYPKAAGWAAISGIGAALADVLWLDPKQSDWRRCGANTQERFDCTVLALVRNEALEGQCPTIEEIYAAAQEYVPNEDAPIADWYPKRAAAEVSLPQGRLVCQRSNLWWDSELRRRYRSWIAVAILVIVVGCFCFGFGQHWSLEQFVLAVLAPLTPALMWAGRECKRQTEGASNLDRLRETTEQIWSQMLKGNLSEEDLTLRSRALQDAILVGRRERATVFDWVYNRLRKQQEKQMNVGADEMISQIRAHEQGASKE